MRRRRERRKERRRERRREKGYRNLRLLAADLARGANPGVPPPRRPSLGSPETRASPETFSNSVREQRVTFLRTPNAGNFSSASARQISQPTYMHLAGSAKSRK